MLHGLNQTHQSDCLLSVRVRAFVAVIAKAACMISCINFKREEQTE